jgi:hypothetical protein
MDCPMSQNIMDLKQRYIIQVYMLEQQTWWQFTKDKMLLSILNKLINLKKREWIEDYCLQLAGYAMAHNFIYKTSITKGVVMMCSKDLYYQEFVIEGLELQKYQHNFLRKVDQYYAQISGTGPKQI